MSTVRVSDTKNKTDLHRKNKLTTTTSSRSLVVVEVEDLVAYKVPRQWVLFKVSALPMMSDYEEDLDDFPTVTAENSSIKAESVVGAYLAESIDQFFRKWNHDKDSTTF